MYVKGVTFLSDQYTRRMSESIPLANLQPHMDEDSVPLIGDGPQTERRGRHHHNRQHHDQEAEERVIDPRHPDLSTSNAVSNAKYSPWSFLPKILYEQFKFFFNLYFLLVALSQAIPALRIGYLSSYVVPLAFVLTVTMGKEAWDDILRRRRDNESNSETYTVLDQVTQVASRDIHVGQLVQIHKDQRIPADMVLLQSSEESAECFIRTDQLDGETDWKLRIAPHITQKLSETDLKDLVTVTAEPPRKSIHQFEGKVTVGQDSMGLSVDNTMWANTVLASGTAVGIVVYVGAETRQALNTSRAGTKTGLLELELNSLSKMLCFCVFLLSFVLVALHGFGKEWYVDVMRFLILFSTIIPVSLRVNLDMAKSVYAYQIEHDSSIPDTVVRTSTIPEDLGRIEYVLSDKTGTLTQNDMEMKKIHVGTVSYAGEAMDEVRDFVNSGGEAGPRSRREIGNRVKDIVTALAICHSVTPSYEDGTLTYQAASPDEIAIVNWTAEVGLRLVRRDRNNMVLQLESTGQLREYEILNVFPFTSESKRMGIVVRDGEDYWFFEKGADTVMASIVQTNDWLEEETANMAREGLRTLVVGRKRLSKKSYEAFSEAFAKAQMAMHRRDHAIAHVITEHLEHDLELLGLTGVEDRLQKDVKVSLELLRNAGIKIWMLTGDKVETARCVAVSSKLVSRGQHVHTITKLKGREAALDQLEYLQFKTDAALLIDGESLQQFLNLYQTEFITVATKLPAVIACRCHPQQKADMALLIREHTKKRVLCIGDGGNDVSMIQAADVGVGIVGKEGRQASLAADFSITQFCHLTKLLLWHGRNSYKRSAKLALFVIHRGLIISVCQTVYSVSSRFEPLALYQGWLMVGYATVYTMMPVFSLVLDKDVDEHLAKLYPELYKELTEGKSLSWSTFFIWVLISLYQGIIVQGLAQVFTGLDQSLFTTMVAVSYTGLLLNELFMVALEVIKWNKTMVITEVVSLGMYCGSIPFLGEYFNLEYFQKPDLYWQVAVILSAALIPVWAAKAIKAKLKPPSYAKVQDA